SAIQNPIGVGPLPSAGVPESCTGVGPLPLAGVPQTCPDLVPQEAPIQNPKSKIKNSIGVGPLPSAGVPESCPDLVLQQVPIENPKSKIKNSDWVPESKIKNQKLQKNATTVGSCCPRSVRTVNVLSPIANIAPAPCAR